MQLVKSFFIFYGMQKDCSQLRLIMHQLNLVYILQTSLFETRSNAISENLQQIQYSVKGPGYLRRNCDSLRAGRSGDRTPAEASFPTPVQTGPGAHPASSTMGTGSFPWVKQPGRGVNHPSPPSAEVKERVELYLYCPSGPSWTVLG